MATAAAARAPDDPQTSSPDLPSSIKISERRTRRVKRELKFDTRTGIAMAMGPTSGGGVLNYAALQEFGTVKMPASPFMRPAWDSGARPALESVKRDLAFEIEKAARRLAVKRARSGG